MLTSPSFAGYAIQGGAEGSWKVAAQFVVPKVTCTGGSSSPERAIAPSVGVYETSKKFSSAGLFVGCFKGKALYLVALTLNGSAHNYTNLAARPGDTVAVRVSQTSKSTVVSTVDKSRTSVKKMLKGGGEPDGQRALGRRLELEQPRTVGRPQLPQDAFSAASLNGMPFGAAGAVARVDRVKGSTTQIRTGALSGNTSFETVFKHS